MTTQLLKERYALKKVIGKGGMGKVYLALDVVSKKHVAIKQIILNETAAVTERFKREYYFLSSIQHTNVIKALDFFQQKQSFFLVLEYIDGLLVKDFICDHGAQTTLKAKLAIAFQMATAIDVINTAGIIHRDIKPTNIMIDRHKKVIKILDLGIARAIQNEMDGLTRTNTPIGTPGYMSPEQVAGEVSANSDVFSLGIVLYQLFLNIADSPFATGNNIVSTMAAITGKDLPPLIEQISLEISWEREIYTEISHLLQKSLQKEPEQRLPNARIMAKTFYKLYKECKSEDSWSLTQQLDPQSIAHLQQLGKKYGKDVSSPEQAQQTSELPLGISENQYIVLIVIVVMLAITTIVFQRTFIAASIYDWEQKINDKTEELQKVEQEIEEQQENLQRKVDEKKRLEQKMKK
ncbi:serine/threonine protein kinase [Candidatus Uabimicrobium amorphum]|uniref:Serine/threonine-protein kinase PksC n=1 Tax=Uabimicrobium amorphum TaxID=2596890 RepID=A0A5S9IM52_UABAM|nr:serine/threonine-protein kinase [Candidatus Uabimicrobium amorphum]BBM83872.1 serine/threonine-protein kinase PksC [Candidatus Uabimicrobium amorphum]